MFRVRRKNNLNTQKRPNRSYSIAANAAVEKNKKNQRTVETGYLAGNDEWTSCSSIEEMRDKETETDFFVFEDPLSQNMSSKNPQFEVQSFDGDFQPITASSPISKASNVSLSDSTKAEKSGDEISKGKTYRISDKLQSGSISKQSNTLEFEDFLRSSPEVEDVIGGKTNSTDEELQPVSAPEDHHIPDFWEFLYESSEGKDVIRGKKHSIAEELEPVAVSKLDITDFLSNSRGEEQQTKIFQIKDTDDQLTELQEKKSASKPLKYSGCIDKRARLKSIKYSRCGKQSNQSSKINKNNEDPRIKSPKNCSGPDRTYITKETSHSSTTRKQLNLIIKSDRKQNYSRKEKKGSTECLSKKSSLVKNSKTKMQSNCTNSTYVQIESENSLPTHSIIAEDQHSEDSIGFNRNFEEQNQTKSVRKGSTQCLSKNSSPAKNRKSGEQSNLTNSTYALKKSQNILTTHSITAKHEHIENRRSNRKLEEQNQATNKRKGSTHCMSKNRSLDKKSKTCEQSNCTNSTCTQVVPQNSMPTHLSSIEYNNSRKSFKTLGYFIPKNTKMSICPITTLKDRFHLG